MSSGTNNTPTNPQPGQTPTAATAAVATLAADTTGKRWAIYALTWSYSAAPAAGATLTIAYGTVTLTWYIIAGGPGFLDLRRPLYFPPNTQVVVTLASGGGSVVGTIYPDAQLEFN